jgi:hypothetical protein
MSTKNFPAAELVSIDCSVAFRATPQLSKLVDDVLQVTQGRGEPINSCDHQRVALAQELEQGLQFFPPLGARAENLLIPDDGAAGGS